MRRQATDKTTSTDRRRKPPARQDPCRGCPALEAQDSRGRPAREVASGTLRRRHSKAVVARVQHLRHNGHPGVLTLIVCLFVILLLAGTISARYGTPVVSGAANRGIVPPSSYRSALLGTPDPLDNTSSLAITGNAGGGKSFRGNIPYGSTTSFGSRLGSTSLDPFLRNSATPEDSSRGFSAPGSFYSPTGTVSKMEPGSTGLFAPGSPRIAAGVMQTPADQPASTMLTPGSPSSQGWTGRGLVGSEATTGPWVSPSVRTSEEMRRIVAGDPDAATTDGGPLRQTKQVMTSQEYQRQLDQLQHDFDGVKARASNFERDLSTGRQPSITEAWAQRSTELPLPPISAETLRRIIQPESPAPPWSSTMNPSAGQDLPPAPATSIPARPAAPGLGELTLLSPGDSLVAPRTEARPLSGPVSYGQPSSVMPSSSELAAQMKRIDAIFTPQTETTAAPKSNESDPTLPAVQRVESLTRAFDTPGQIRRQPQQAAAGDGPASPPRVEEAAPSPDKLRALFERAPAPTPAPPQSPRVPETFAPAAPPAPLDPATPSPDKLRSLFEKAPAQTPAPPKAPRAPETSAPAAPPPPLDPAAQEKLEACLKLAQSQMQQGQCAQAAESFALAAVYNPRDARPQLGRSHALLAAGEYLGSAVCLAKAIEFDPRLSLAELDLVEAVGGPDRFLQRFTDLQERAKSNNAPGLQLLLAYIYQQMKRPEEAKAAIQAAKKALPSSVAVDLLEKAIR